MKKSRKLSLVLMGSILLSACGSKADEPQVFKDKAECIASGKFNEDQCTKMEAEAKEQTPKFATREECVKQFGENACAQTNHNGGSFFMPMLMGFMAGKLLGGGGNMAPSQGLFPSPNGNQFQTAKGVPVSVPPNFGSPASSSVNKASGNSSNNAVNRTAPRRPSPLGNAVSRGGFSAGSRSIGA